MSTGSLLPIHFPSAFQLDKQSGAEAKYLIWKNTVEGKRNVKKKPNTSESII